jgi:hypothetical protein
VQYENASLPLEQTPPHARVPFVSLLFISLFCYLTLNLAPEKGFRCDAGIS